LWKRFGKGKKANVVVKDLYFGVERGEVFGLLGPNGAGKTTTLNMITGAIGPSRGQVSTYNINHIKHATFNTNIFIK
jgi:ABC-type multidrug transport system ATPase subunit